MAESPDPLPATDAGERGTLGCLGWGLVAAGAVVVLAVAVLIAGWILLPTLASPTDADWEMAEADPEHTEEIRERLEEGMDRALAEERHVVVLTEEDLNALLAQSLERWRPEDLPPEDRPRFRFRLEEGVVALDVVGPVPEDVGRVPGRLEGAHTGLSLDLRPRADGDVLALGVVGARLGRIPLPVGLAMGLLPHLPLDPEVAFLDPARGELRIPLEPLVGVPALPEGVHLRDLREVDGTLHLEFARVPR